MHGAVAAGDERTADAAVEILRAGGNAVDAAIAAAFATFVAEPLLASPGGGGILTLALAGREPVVVDFFSDAPGRGGVTPDAMDFDAVEVDFGSAKQIFHVGRASAAIPSALDGLAEAARRFGTLSLADLVEPAARFARDGVAISAETAHVFGLLWPILSRDAETAALFSPRGDGPPLAQTILVNEALAATLREVGASGGTTERIRAAILAAFGPSRGGLITADDLAAQRPEILAPHRIDLGDWTVLTSPRVGGHLVATIARALARGAPRDDEASEVVRFARASGEGHAARAGLTVPGSTTHVSVVDADGGAAAVTLTNGEGCGHLAPGTGFQVNNFLGEEDLSPHGFHAHAPGTRLPTMIAPTVALRRGVPALALGSGGANRIRTVVAQVLYRAAVLGQSIERAVLAPRVHVEEDTAWCELAGLADPERARSALEAAYARVFAFAERDFFFGGVHAVERDEDGSLRGAGDRRRGGVFVRV